MVGVQKDSMVVNGVGTFETTRKQLAITSRYCLKIAGGVLELDPVQKSSNSQ